MSDPIQTQIQTLNELKSELDSLCNRIGEQITKREGSGDSIDRFLYRVFERTYNKCIAVKSVLEEFDDVVKVAVGGAWGRLVTWYADLYVALRHMYNPLDAVDVLFDDPVLSKVGNAGLTAVTNIITANAHIIAREVVGDIVTKLCRIERYAGIVRNDSARIGLARIFVQLYDAIYMAERGFLEQSLNLAAEAVYTYDVAVSHVDDYGEIRRLIDSIIAAIPYIYATRRSVGCKA